jgi:molybdopterin-guanine dinucleotide biosynthesis protein A
MLQDVTGLVLAGGQGRRMGGLDKGLQSYNGRPLVQHALERLSRQQGGAFGGLMVNANRNLQSYAAIAATYGASVVADTHPDFAGPLAGLCAGLENCATPYLLTVPCDCPFFPLDLALRLQCGIQAREHGKTALVIAATTSQAWQPTFCLVHRELHAQLHDYLQQGGRRFREWIEQQGAQIVLFKEDEAFANINTLEQLQALERG